MSEYIVPYSIVDRLEYFLNAARESSLRVEVAVLANDILQLVTIDKFNTMRLEQTFNLRGDGEVQQRTVYDIDQIYTALKRIHRSGEAARMIFGNGDGSIILELANEASVDELKEADERTQRITPMEATDISVMSPQPQCGRYMTQVLGLLPPLLELCIFSHALPMRIELSSTRITYIGTSIFGEYKWQHTFESAEQGDDAEDSVCIDVTAKFNRYVMYLLQRVDEYTTTVYGGHSVVFVSGCMRITLYAV